MPSWYHTGMTTTAVFYRLQDPNPNKQAEFDRVAGDLSIKYGEAARGAYCGEQLLHIADAYDDFEVEHLIAVCHGFSTRLLSGTAGVHVTQHKPPAVVSLDAFVRAWEPKLTKDCRISLCACMCGRDPYGLDDYWAPSSHADGGTKSFAGKLRDAMLDHGVRAEVRSHTNPGHVLNNPCGRVFLPVRGAPGRSLFNMSVGDKLGVKRTWKSARQFNELVKGAIAARWILFDGDVVPEILARW